MWSFNGGDCVKQVDVKGAIGERPKENATCQVTICVKDGAHIQCGESEYLKDHFDGTLVVGNADCEVDRQIERCVQTMVSGEESTFTVSFKEYPSSVVIGVGLVVFAQYPDMYKWTRVEKLEVARRHKQKGVELFQTGRLSDSFLKFNKAVKLAITLGIENDEEARLLYIHTCNNMAWCHLKQDSLAHALTLCNKVLNVDPENVKALLRRSEAYTRLNDIDLAALDLRQVRKIEPNNGIARERYIVLQHRIEMENIKYSNVIKRMFQ